MAITYPKGVHPKQYDRQQPDQFTDDERHALTLEFYAKNDVLRSSCVEVDPFTFYRDLFPEGTLEHFRDVCSGEPSEVGDERHSNGIITILEDINKPGWRHNLIIFDDLAAVQTVQGQQFAITAPVSFSGRRRTSENAYLIHGICIDLDDVGEWEVVNLINQMQNDILVPATYIVNSGTGLHIYYFLDTPIPAFKHLYPAFGRLKSALTNAVWNAYTSRSKVRQYQGPFQGYRVPGTQTKFGGECRVTAFRFSRRVSLKELNDFVDEKDRVNFDDIHYINRAEAKERWPEWYERRKIGTADSVPVGSYQLNETQKVRKRALYDKWLQQVRKSAKVGNRYFHLAVLFNFAMKAEIPLEDAETDAMQLLPYLQSLTLKPEDVFVEDDVVSAEKFYDRKYIKLGIEGIKRMTGVELPRNKCNGRSRKEHLQAPTWINPKTGRPEINTCKRNRELVLADMAAKGEILGRPTMEQTIRDYIEAHPDARKCDVIRDLGISKNTCYKWWKVIVEGQELPKKPLRKQKNLVIYDETTGTYVEELSEPAVLEGVVSEIRSDGKVEIQIDASKIEDPEVRALLDRLLKYQEQFSADIEKKSEEGLNE